MNNQNSKYMQDYPDEDGSERSDNEGQQYVMPVKAQAKKKDRGRSKSESRAKSKHKNEGDESDEKDKRKKKKAEKSGGWSIFGIFGGGEQKEGKAESSNRSLEPPKKDRGRSNSSQRGELKSK